jgi:hypothetical protein
VLEVRDGDRTLQFEGTLLAKSSSERRGVYRWIEFELYLTKSGSYILSRIGVSAIYHGAACSLVKRYSLTEVAASAISSDALPCEECSPTLEADLLFPEKHRYWAQVSDSAVAVLDALYKYDDNGTKYLTNVAKRLLESACTRDSDIAEIYLRETIL